METNTLRIGIDIGTSSIKAVAIKYRTEIEKLPGKPIGISPLESLRETIKAIYEKYPGKTFLIGMTGSGAIEINKILGFDHIEEIEAITQAVSFLYPFTRTIVQMGKETQMYMELVKSKSKNELHVSKCELGNRCAAGCGSFIEHMTKRLKFGSIDNFVASALLAETPATIAGRCAVFAESDITHLYQKGTGKERIAAGICQAIARNFQTIAKGGKMEDNVIFIGGVSENKAIKKYLAHELKIKNLTVPEFNNHLGAIGAARMSNNVLNISEVFQIIKSEISKPACYNSGSPIKLNLSEIFSKTEKEEPNVPVIENAYLGIDIGSVSTKAALLTMVAGELKIISEIYRRTDGDPLVAVIDVISKIKKELDSKNLRVMNITAATTGSGRYLTADYIGAFAVDEITAQANGALFYNPNANIVLEIGGQDSKIIYLKNGTMTDYAMNKACAAGCGAFLEEMAEILNIALDEFGDIALRNTRPPAINWTCTVFTKSAIMKLLLEGVCVNDLASAVCIASVHNYLAKNVGNREIEGDVVFQGAVAFNKGMVASFESILGRKITVPEFPHVTGAIGAARYIFNNHKKAKKFKGFDKISESNYSIDSFECGKCANKCDVNIFKVEDDSFYYNDRCEDYSGKRKAKTDKILPNLFNEYEEMLMHSFAHSEKPNAKKIGIPRGLMFNEYYPLYGTFFEELGFNVVASEKTNKSLIKNALEISMEEPCFPFKVHYGHVDALMKKNVDYIFLPTVITTEQNNKKMEFSKTCPYLQGASKMVTSLIDIPLEALIQPVIYFNRGKKHLEIVFLAIAKRLGKNKKDALKALKKALINLDKFRKNIRARGEEITSKLPEAREVWVVTGRPYTLYDPALNMNIGKKIIDVGVLPIPINFLPLDDIDISDTWSGIYSKQIQKKLEAGKFAKSNPNVRVVNLSYFGCGPDSFGNPFFDREYQKHSLELQLDEHTSDTGLITRVEAFYNTKDVVTRVSSVVTDKFDDFKMLRNKILWIPNASEGAKMLAASFRAYGIDARVLQRSPNMSLELARKKIHTDVCLPMLVTTEDMLYRINECGFDEGREWFFQGNSNGPCRYGMYDLYQKIILGETGIGAAKIVSLGRISQDGSMGLMFTKLAFDTMLAHDILLRMHGRTKPYEVNSGDSKYIYNKYVEKIIKIIPEYKHVLETNKLKVVLGFTHHDLLKELLSEAEKEFLNIQKTTAKKPLVGVLGEFFVRINEFSNQNIIDKLESYGLETWLAPMTEFFSYSAFISKLLAYESMFSGELSLKNFSEWIKYSVRASLSKKSEHELAGVAGNCLKDREDIDPEELVRLGSHYIVPDFGGEPICTMGKMEDFAWRDLDGIVTVMPMNCIPGITSLVMSQKFKADYDIPLLNLDYDGFASSIKREQEIKIFASLATDRFLAK